MRNLFTASGKLLYINLVFWLAIAVSTLVYYYAGYMSGYIVVILAIFGLLGWSMFSSIRSGLSDNLNTGLLILLMLGCPGAAFLSFQYVYYSNGSLVKKGLSFEEVFQGRTKYVFFDANDFGVDPRTTGYVYKLHKAQRSNSADVHGHYYVMRLNNSYGWNKNSLWLIASSRKEFERLKKEPQKFFTREAHITNYTIQAVQLALKTENVPEHMIFVKGSTHASMSSQGQLYGQVLFYAFFVVNILLLVAFVTDKGSFKK